jgi:hypothetical protein
MEDDAMPIDEPDPEKDGDDTVHIDVWPPRDDEE